MRSLITSAISALEIPDDNCAIQIYLLTYLLMGENVKTKPRHDGQIKRQRLFAKSYSSEPRNTLSIGTSGIEADTELYQDKYTYKHNGCRVA